MIYYVYSATVFDFIDGPADIDGNMSLVEAKLANVNIRKF